MNKLGNLSILTDPAKVKKILNSYKTGLIPTTKVKNVKISTLQSYQDNVSYNIKALYTLTPMTDDKKPRTKKIVAAFSWPRNREYGYSMGKYIYNKLDKKMEVSVPEQYAYIKKYNLVLMENMPGLQLTKVITKNKRIEAQHLESILKWLARFQNIKPDKKTFRTVDFYHLENNIRILKKQKNPKAELFDKEFRIIRKAITAWSKQYQQALVHGDFNPANILVNKSSIAILDFENVHYGDGLLDIANLSVYISFLLKSAGVGLAEIRKTEKYLLETYEKYSKPLTPPEEQRLETYKKYFVLLFKTHPLVWA